jgi:hypothetical protein
MGLPIDRPLVDATANSGRVPGMAETLGVGAAADRLGSAPAIGGDLHVVSETGLLATRQATRLDKSLDRQIVHFCIRQAPDTASRSALQHRDIGQAMHENFGF